MGFFDTIAGAAKGVWGGIGSVMNNITGASQGQQWTQDNMATAFQYDQQAFNQQKELANTAHQREVSDLRAAGLNPILSAGGGGAQVPKMDTPGPGAGGKGGNLLDVAGTIMSGVNSAKEREVADEKIQQIAEDTHSKTIENKIKSDTAGDAIRARRAALKEQQTESENNARYNEMDKSNPNANYILHKANGGGANSASKLMGIVKTIGEIIP
ncbi:MAG: DNA pilot protein [Microviridae sp.]|nr:MAG: DNA pilot protein [Microviridae sp.]